MILLSSKLLKNDYERRQLWEEKCAQESEEKTDPNGDYDVPQRRFLQWDDFISKKIKWLTPKPESYVQKRALISITMVLCCTFLVSLASSTKFDHPPASRIHETTSARNIASFAMANMSLMSTMKPYQSSSLSARHNHNWCKFVAQIADK